MAQLYFYYAAMNAGKSTSMLQSAYNYREQGMRVVVLTAAIDHRYGVGKVTSRIGLQSDALLFQADTDLFDLYQQVAHDGPIHCILVDEAQFLKEKQVRQLTKIVDQLNIPVLCYGLRTDFKGDLFPGSQCLLAWADKLIELKTVCFCGRKATMVVRLDSDGRPLQAGDQVAIGGNDLYQSMCRSHFAEKMAW
jgi:thymidine kinase